MIYTSNHNSCNFNENACAISGNRGRDANYNGRCYPRLAPKLSFWKTWHDNIGKITEEENNKFYIQEYYNQVLSKLNPKDVYDELNNSILLCYEDNMAFCHRHIVAEWFELSLGVTVPEIQMINNELIEVQRPKYIRTILEEIMFKKQNPKQKTKVNI